MMKNGKFQRRGAAKRGAGKSIAVLLVLVLVLGCAIGGTIAWLTDKTDEVKNTFTVGNIKIDLTETGTTNNAKTYDVVPGGTYSKDPKVTVEAGSEACWLFVEVTEANNTLPGSNPAEKIVDWSVREGWTKLDVTGKNVWYKSLGATTANTDYYILTGDTANENGFVTVNDDLTKTMIDATDFKAPTLSFKAYAIQSANLKNSDGTEASTAAQAWALVNAN